MSIRLRLTLLYSAVLTFVLIAVSVALYIGQARATDGSYLAVLVARARHIERLQGLRQRVGGPRDGGPRPRFVLPEPLPGSFLQVRDGEGEVLIPIPEARDSQLPLSPQGLAAVQSGDDWLEVAALNDLSGEPSAADDESRFLVYSRPMRLASGEAVVVQVARSLAERDQAQASLGRLLWLVDALAILIAFASGWFVAGAALRPLQRLTETAQAIGSSRDFAQRVDYHGPQDEVGRLATTFNAMLAALETAFVQVEQALANQRRFVADASHELRTPLTTIRGNVGLLKMSRPPLDPSDAKAVLADLESESERMMRLVSELLALARTDSGRAPATVPVKLLDLVEEVIRQLRPVAPDRDIALEVAPDLTGLADRDTLKQVLLILLENALLHTPPAVALGVRARPEADGKVAIAVWDEGPGIPEAHLPLVFDRFFRGSASRTGTGTGLGLSIAKALVEAQQGTLAVDSGQGTGTTFTVRLRGGG